MIKPLFRVLGLALLGSAAVPAWSIPIATVGANDLLIAETRLSSSGDAAESNWVASILGFTIALNDRTEGWSVWDRVQGAAAGTYAIDFGATDSPSHFLVKTGNVTNDGNRHFLFQNLESLRYGVMFLGDLGISITNIKGVSHTTDFGDGRVVVSEPGALMLLAIGLLGIALARRRRA